MADEKILTLNLRKSVVKYPRWIRSQKISSLLRQKVQKQMKTKKVKIDKEVNQRIWKGGLKKDYIIRVKLKKETNGSISVKPV